MARRPGWYWYRPIDGRWQIVEVAQPRGIDELYVTGRAFSMQLARAEGEWGARVPDRQHATIEQRLADRAREYDDR